MKIRVNEIFGPTIQGEGSTVGKPCFFLRVAGCNLHCGWCDTYYTWNYEGTTFSNEHEFGEKVKMDDEVVAVIEVGSTRTAAFSEEDRKLVEIIAEHIGSSLRRLMRNRFGLKPNNGLRDFM